MSKYSPQFLTFKIYCELNAENLPNFSIQAANHTNRF